MLVAFHKPYGVLSQFTPDHPGQRTLAEFEFPKGIFPIGRLDQDSEGLLLLGNEPRLVARLLDAGATRVVVRPNAVKSDAEMAAQLETIAKALR